MPKPNTLSLPAFLLFRRHGIITGTAERIASENPPRRQQGTLERPMHPQRLKSVFGTRRSKAATRRKQRSNAKPVNTNRNHQNPRRQAYRTHTGSITPAFSRAFANTALTSCIFACRISRRGITTIPQGAISFCNSRNDSRTRRLARLRRTALLSNFRLHITPHFREMPNSRPDTNAVKYRVVTRRPFFLTASNSLFSFSLHSGFSRKPEFPALSTEGELSTLTEIISIRERVSCGLSDDDGREPCGRRGLPFWRGNRTCAVS